MIPQMIDPSTGPLSWQDALLEVLFNNADKLTPLLTELVKGLHNRETLERDR